MRNPTTVGSLAQAFVENTMALKRANNKLITICQALGRCDVTTGPGVTK